MVSPAWGAPGQDSSESQPGLRAGWGPPSHGGMMLGWPLSVERGAPRPSPPRPRARVNLLNVSCLILVEMGDDGAGSPLAAGL